MSAKVALIKVCCLCTCAGVVAGGGAVHVAERQAAVTHYVKHNKPAPRRTARRTLVKKPAPSVVYKCEAGKVVSQEINVAPAVVPENQTISSSSGNQTSVIGGGDKGHYTGSSGGFYGGSTSGGTVIVSSSTTSGGNVSTSTSSSSSSSSSSGGTSSSSSTSSSGGISTSGGDISSSSSTSSSTSGGFTSSTSSGGSSGTPVDVPEPPMMVLFGMAVLGLIIGRKSGKPIVE